MSQQRTATGARLLAVETTAADHRITIALCGQADASTHEELRGALAGLDLGGGRHVDLRLSELEFCDVASARELIDLAYAVRTSGGTVRVTGAPNVWVRTMLTILDVAGDLPLAERGPHAMDGDG